VSDDCVASLQDWTRFLPEEVDGMSSRKFATFCHAKFGQRPEYHHIPEYVTVWTICKKKVFVLIYSLGKNT
jgi:hypothetical protein